jgi:4-aminobutyrate aminotransferase-like enzyme
MFGAVMDCCGGAAVACLGNGNQRVINAMKAQIDDFCFCYSVPFSHPSAERVRSHPREYLRLILSQAREEAYRHVGRSLREGGARFRRQ